MKKFLLIILALALFGGGFAAWKFFGQAINTSQGEFLYVPTGAAPKQLRDSLLARKHLSGTYWFDLTARILKFDNARPGRYRLKEGMSVFQLVRMLRSGRQEPVNFVITRFRTREDFARRAGRQFEFDSLQMISFLNNRDSLARYGFDTSTVIAALMPYTYSLNWNSTPRQLFDRCYAAYTRFWTAERKSKADSLGLSPVEVVTIASIIEEETNYGPEKPNMASVYLNRVRKGMPLQADPTLKFALRDFSLRRILNVHKGAVSPYNTYMHKGIPPGPICTPSVESIEAVLNAPQTEYLYFVASSNFDGSHIFTTSYEDHLKYATEYQQALNRRWDSLSRSKPQQP